jgi:hypothetical protein
MNLLGGTKSAPSQSYVNKEQCIGYPREEASVKLNY